MAQLMAEVCRLHLLQGLEEALRSAGFVSIAGVDEVGRGSLAGPVVAAAVVVEAGTAVPGVDDSKRLSPRRRQRLASAIRCAHPVHRVAAVDPRTIDRINILEATKLAMRRATSALDPAPDMTLIDAVEVPGLETPSLPVIRGDSLSYAIACASIVAKVDRDRFMDAMALTFPHYGFQRNKGYGSEEHRRALVRYGPCEMHRLTFRSVLPDASRADSSMRVVTDGN